MNRLVLAGSGKGGWAFALHQDGAVLASGSGGLAGASSWAMLSEAMVSALPSLPKGEVLVLVRNTAFQALVHRVVAGDAIKKREASRRLLECLEAHRDAHGLELVCDEIEKTHADYKTVKAAAVKAAVKVASSPGAGESIGLPAGSVPAVPPLADTQVWIWTDGGCRLSKDGLGGWGTMIVHAVTGATLELWGGTTGSTNNRMELQAVIEGLNALSRPTHVELRVDSTYVRNMATKWAHAWKQNGWRKRDGEPVKNQDLVIALDAALRPHTVVWTWVKGHSGEPGNTRVDGLCARAMDAIASGEPGHGRTRHEACPVRLPPKG